MNNTLTTNEEELLANFIEDKTLAEFDYDTYVKLYNRLIEVSYDNDIIIKLETMLIQMYHLLKI